MLNYNGFCQLISKSDVIINNLSGDLGVTKASVLKQTHKFFNDKNVIVQTGGVHETGYKVGLYLQSAGSAGVVAQTLPLAKLAGVRDLQILKGQPYLAVAILTTGALFFYKCRAVAGNNAIRKILVTTADTLALPPKSI